MGQKTMKKGKGMKDWKFVALWAFILISGELILYGRYYILFYKPYIPFKLVQAFHSATLGIDWKDERSGWYYTIQYVGDDTLEDVSISWIRSWYDPSADNLIDRYRLELERIFIEKILPEQNFTISTRTHEADVTITYHKGVALETEEIKWTFDVEDAVEVIPEEWRLHKEPDDPYAFLKPIAHARAATVFPQILGVILLLICVVVMSYFVIEIRAKRLR